MTRKDIIANLKGINLPVVTPFDSRGEVDEGAFRENLRRYADVGLAGIVVAGSSGEAPHLTERERLRLVELARRIVSPPQLLIVGTGLESTRETLRLSREAVAHGADAVLAITPSYYKARMDSAALTAHFRTVADGLRRPIILYSIPPVTGLRMKPEAIAKLSYHPNIAGIKESSGDLAFLRAIVRKSRPGFRVLVGSALILLEALRAGAAGAVVSLAGVVPELCVGIYTAFCQGRIKVARNLAQKLMHLAEHTVIPYGVPALKAALDLSGYCGGVPRPPLLPLDPASRRLLAAALKETRVSLEF